MRLLMRHKALGFTLAELLSALAILGVIATFTIPKVLTASQASQHNSQAKDVAAMITQAYSQYQLETGGSYMQSDGLLPYFNYVRNDNTSMLDTDSHNPVGVDADCSGGGIQCLVLHGGGTLYFYNTVSLCNDATTAIPYYFDPDGTNGDAFQAITIYLYDNSYMTTGRYIKSSTRYGYNSSATCSATVNPNAGSDPSWFSW